MLLIYIYIRYITKKQEKKRKVIPYNVIQQQSAYQITAFKHSPKLSPYIQVLLKWSKNKVLILLKAEEITMQKKSIKTKGMFGNSQLVITQ